MQLGWPLYIDKPWKEVTSLAYAQCVYTVCRLGGKLNGQLFAGVAAINDIRADQEIFVRLKRTAQSRDKQSFAYGLPYLCIWSSIFSLQQNGLLHIFVCLGILVDKKILRAPRRLLWRSGTQ